MANLKNNKELLRNLSLTAAVMIVSGSMIGSGIFRKPSTMAAQLMSPELLILAWVFAGLLTFIGAISNAEVAGMYKSTGGQYLYFKDMYGDFIAYIFGWSVLAVILTGSQAAIAYVFAEYLGYFFTYPEAPSLIKDFSIYIPLVGNIFPFEEFGTKIVAILSIVFLTWVNYIGVFFGGIVQTVVTYIKIVAMIGLILLIFVFGEGTVFNIYKNFSIPNEVSGNIFVLFGLALAGAFWAYDGWNNVTYVSGEIKEAQKNVPRALFLGTLIVVVIYVLINLAYLYVLPIEEMKDSPLVAASAIERIFGKKGASFLVILVVLSTFGALNGSLLAAARVQFAMAKTNLFFNFFGKVHPKYSTPHSSLLVQGIWSSLLVMSGTFDTISDYVMFAAWLFYMLGAAGVFILRKKFPNRERPYKVWGYPFTPAIFVIFSFLYLLNSIISDTENAMMGTILILLGLPVYFYRRYFSKKQTR